MRETRTKYDRMRSYYDSLIVTSQQDEHDMFIESFATVAWKAKDNKLKRPATPRLNIALEQEINRVSAWLKSNTPAARRDQ